METLLTNAYTRLDEKSKLFETSSVAIGTKELLQKKSLCQKISFIGLCTFCPSGKRIQTFMVTACCANH